MCSTVYKNRIISTVKLYKINTKFEYLSVNTIKRQWYIFLQINEYYTQVELALKNLQSDQIENLCVGQTKISRYSYQLDSFPNKAENRAWDRRSILLKV